MTQDIIESILINTEKKVEGIKLYNYVEKSASSDFYYNQFLENGIPTSNESPDFSKVPTEMNEAMDFFKKRLSKDSIVVELGGSRYQHRSGYPHHFFDNYIPLDISYTSINAYVKKYDRFGIVADASVLPFKDNSIDAILTHTFLEHPLKPELVLSEINRVLKPGGYIIHSDAWNCRWWQRFGVVGVKKFNEMLLKEKLIYIAAKLTELKIFRIPKLIIKRALVILFTDLSKPIHLKYRKLKPNYTLNLFKDEDAASSIDPVNVILFYESIKYTCYPKLGFINKLFFNKLNIYLQKSNY